ncbi:MAG TPA: hypothetical protein VH394_28635 [Thermoanaerobaculia bacterium]|jgi:hypothetical protein|nr:hypothetical protein [Thermoanaerobaculia bacterium]
MSVKVAGLSPKRRYGSFLLSFITATALLSSCRTSQNTRLHLGTGDQITVDTTIAKLQDTAEQLRVQEASIERHPDFSLGTIEFNDEGLSFSSQQRLAVTKMILDEARDRGIILVVFIHGWKHNATVCDTNLSCFRSVLQELGQREKVGARRRVIGVYLGWRGLTYCNPIGRQFSFWTRKRIGERLGTNQARRTINDLLLLHNQIKRLHSDTRFVAVGHSLGGGVLFSAIGPLYRQALHDAIEERRGSVLDPIQGFLDPTGCKVELPDLVVLANPAFEAELYKRTPADLVDMRKKGARFSPAQFPLLLSVSSDGDTATHIVFPVGQTVRLLFSPIMWLRGGSYLRRNIIAAANYGPYITDLASAVAETSTPSAEPVPSRPGNCFADDFSKVTGGDCGCRLNPPQVASTDEENQPFSAKSRSYGNVHLERLPSVDPNNPFIVAKATRAVLKNHSDIFNPTFISFLIELVHRVDEHKSGLAIQSRLEP